MTTTTAPTPTDTRRCVMTGEHSRTARHARVECPTASLPTVAEVFDLPVFEREDVAPLGQLEDAPAPMEPPC